jgi:protease I
MELTGKKIAVLAEDVYEDLELWYPVLRMREAGADVVIVGTGGKDTYESKHGYPVEVDVAADAVKPEDYAAVIVPGGYAPDKLRRYPAVLNLVCGVSERGGLVAMICHAGWVAVSAGILKGKTVTSTPAIKDDLINAGVKWVDQEVVVDGNLISSRSPDDLPAFCRAIIEHLRG